MTAQLSGTDKADSFCKGKEESHLIDGAVLAPIHCSSSTSSKVVVSGVRRLSTISEQNPDVEVHSPDLEGGSEWAGSSASLFTADKHINSSDFSSFESHHIDSGDDCAALLLACLYCRFYDLVVMLPGTCKRAVTRCFPSCKYYNVSSEPTQGKDCCNCNMELDCSLWNACQETSELLELAMEISEVCYR